MNNKFSQIPLTVNTDNKESVPATGSGVVDSVGVALSVYDFFLMNLMKLGYMNTQPRLRSPNRLTKNHL